MSLLLLGLALGADPGALVPPVDGAYDAALVVGIEDYLLLPDVQGAAANAAEWVDYLEARGVPSEHIVWLRDAEANDARIRARAAEVARWAGPQGRVWVVFVGHGAPSVEGAPLLVGVDAAQDAETLFARSLPREELLDVLGSGGRPVVAIIDACFSGRDRAGDALVPGLQPVVPVFASEPVASRTVVGASAADQFAGAWPAVDRPALSWLLLHPSTPGEFTLAEGVADAERQLRSIATRRQTPSIEGPGALVLGTVGASVPQPAPVARPRDRDRPKDLGWKISTGALAVGAGAFAWGSFDRRAAAIDAGYPDRVDATVRAARTDAVLAWTLGGLSAASLTVVVVR